MAKIEVGFANNLGKEFYEQRGIPVDKEDQPYYPLEFTEVIKGKQIKQSVKCSLGDRIVINVEDDEAGAVAETFFVPRKSSGPISWVVYRNGAFQLEGEENLPEKIQLGLQWADRGLHPVQEDVGVKSVKTNHESHGG